MKTILAIEDDAAILRGLADLLSGEHYRVLTATTGRKGAQLARQEAVDLIILDLGLPDMKGEDVCASLRKDGIQTPILILTSKNQETDKVVGLELGADDYVTKPFSLRELLARVRALLRRQTGLPRDLEAYSFGDVHVDFRKQEATRGGKPFDMGTREMHVLKCLILHQGEVVTRDMLLNEVWGYETFPTTRTVDNYILSLRKLVEDVPSKPRFIVTVHTSGYKFVPGDPPPPAGNGTGKASGKRSRAGK